MDQKSSQPQLPKRQSILIKSPQKGSQVNQKRNSILIQSPKKHTSQNPLQFNDNRNESKNMQILKQGSSAETPQFKPDQYINNFSNSRDVITAKMLFDYICDEDFHEILPTDLRKQFINCGHNIPKKYLYKMISDFDLDMNGTIDFNEFLRILHSRPCDMDTKPQVQHAFDQIDLDFKGYIDEQDLIDLAAEFNEPEPTKEMLTLMKQQLGADQYGRISFEKFHDFNFKRQRHFNLSHKNSLNQYKT